MYFNELFRWQICIIVFANVLIMHIYNGPNFSAVFNKRTFNTQIILHCQTKEFISEPGPMYSYKNNICIHPVNERNTNKTCVENY